MVLVLVDANRLSSFFSSASGDTPRLRDALIDGTSIQLSVGGKKQKAELAALPQVLQLVTDLGRAGKLSVTAESTVDEAEEELVASELESNDTHMLALAQVGGGRVLVSDDTALCRDFTNPSLINNPRGFIYKSDTQHWRPLKRRFQL